MEANQTHISLETAKLLKDCGVESRYSWQYLDDVCDLDKVSRNTSVVGTLTEWMVTSGVLMRWDEDLMERLRINSKDNNFFVVKLPAYTRQEILWEYADKFWEEGVNGYDKPMIKVHTEEITWYLRKKLYEKADEYFREHTILLDNKQD